MQDIVYKLVPGLQESQCPRRGQGMGSPAPGSCRELRGSRVGAGGGTGRVQGVPLYRVWETLSVGDSAWVRTYEMPLTASVAAAGAWLRRGGRWGGISPQKTSSGARGKAGANGPRSWREVSGGRGGRARGARGAAWGPGAARGGGSVLASQGRGGSAAEALGAGALRRLLGERGGRGSPGSATALVGWPGTGAWRRVLRRGVFRQLSSLSAGAPAAGLGGCGNGGCTRRGRLRAASQGPGAERRRGEPTVAVLNAKRRAGGSR